MPTEAYTRILQALLASSPTPSISPSPSSSPSSDDRSVNYADSSSPGLSADPDPSPSPESGSVTCPLDAPPPSPLSPDRLFVSPEEVALQWSLFYLALARDATDPVSRSDRVSDSDRDTVSDDTNTLLRYVVGSDVESVLRGAGVRLDGLLLDAEVNDDDDDDDDDDYDDDASAAAALELDLGTIQLGG